MKHLFLYCLLCASLALPARGLSMTSQQRGQKANDPETIRAFVRKTYMEGIPYNQVQRMSPSLALPVLIKMLDDPRDEQYWTNIVVTLGMLGDGRAVNPLINFITRSEERSELSPPQAEAKTSAVMSLGYIVNKTGNRQALTFLAEGVDLGRPNRLSAVDRFLDSKCQSRFSDVRWRHIFNEKRFIQGCELRAILISTTL
jgi:HEAT repeat protein